jgi:hypothetical protein
MPRSSSDRILQDMHLDLTTIEQTVIDIDMQRCYVVGVRGTYLKDINSSHSRHKGTKKGAAGR